MNKNIAILEMQHGVYAADLPPEMQEIMLRCGVEEIPAVMPSSQPVDGRCLIQALVNADVSAEDLQKMEAAGIKEVGRYGWKFEVVKPMDAATYDKYLTPLKTFDEEGNVTGEEPQQSLKITSIFAGQVLPEGGVWPV